MYGPDCSNLGAILRFHLHDKIILKSSTGNWKKNHTLQRARNLLTKISRANNVEIIFLYFSRIQFLYNFEKKNSTFKHKPMQAFADVFECLTNRASQILRITRSHIRFNDLLAL
ncbi:hypothetical protein ACJX0J_036834, partial [Zea mays]